MSELEERARRVLERARSEHSPSGADAERVRARLSARILAEPLLLEPHLTAPQPLEQLGGRLAARAIAAKWLVAFAIGGGAGFAAGFTLARGLAPAAPPGVSARVASSAQVRPEAEATPDVGAGVNAAPEIPPLASGTPAAAAPASGEAAPHLAPLNASERATRQRPSPSSSRESSGTTSALQAELAGLRRAQELLFQGDAAWALARLDELDRAQVGNVLLEERMATRAIAECMLGKDARAQADEFARRFPGSPQLERVRSSCAAAPKAVAPSENRTPAQTETPGSQHE